MNAELGSIMGCVYKKFPATVYHLNVPQDFNTPSLYFPTPTVVDGNDTTTTFLKTYILPIKLFHHDSEQAFREAEKIADTIRADRGTISMLNEEGLETGDYLSFTRIETRIIEEGVATLVLTWDSRYSYNRDEVHFIQNIEIESEVK